MRSVDSAVAAFDGESKCGKTTIITSVATEAAYQSRVIPDILEDTDGLGQYLDGERRQALLRLQDRFAFNNVTTISAGNSFRAATYYAMIRGKAGQEVSRFTEDDVDRLRELMAKDGIYETLQNDQEIGSRVSSVAKLAGVQALCSTIFCDSIVEAYHADGGANLVIVDARDPVGHMRRNGILGVESGQIRPASILPVYIETPTEVAAMRMGGDLQEKIAEVSNRRSLDANRTEYPVVKPDKLITSYSDWQRQFTPPRDETEVVLPYRLYNGEGISLDSIQNFAGHIATMAQDVAATLAYSRASV